MADGADHGDTRVADLSNEEFYTIVRLACKDALLDVIGTLLLVGIGLLLFWTGVAGAVAAGTGANSVLVVAGVFVALVGVYVAAAALDYVPSFESLLRAD